jgi:hypothetical protein
MFRWRGACVVGTQEGEVTLPANFDGWIAIDRAGYPYPIDIAEHEATYEEA